jgi:hypothetical protein
MPLQWVVGNGVELCAVVYGLWWVIWSVCTVAPVSIDRLL